MANLNITVPCATDLVPFTYSYCLIFRSGSDGYSVTCNSLCNPEGYVGDSCCRFYDAFNGTGLVIQVSWTNCCTGEPMSAEVNPFQEISFCSRTYPTWTGLGSPNITDLGICNCDDDSDLENPFGPLA